MRDVTDKFETLRVATAEGFVRIPREGLELMRERRVEKGDPLQVARVAGILAAKDTAKLIPYCHQIPLTHIDLKFSIEEEGVRIRSTVKGIAQTGVEMEALTSVSVASLVIYDMLKPHVKEIVIGEIRLIEKKGGKSDFRREFTPPLHASVLVLSDTVYAGKKEDRAGKAVLEVLKREGIEVDTYEILPDDSGWLKKRVEELLKGKPDLLITVGGTGLSPRDITVDTIRPMLKREIPGIMEASRAYGQRRTPYAMLSRGIAGMIGNTLILTLPGSSRGAKESCEALFPGILHIFEVMRKIPHKEGYR